MNTRPFGKLGTVSAYTLGGGGVGRVFGTTTWDEAVATVREAAAAGITLLDMAPSYGDGEAEKVVGEAFGGKLPEGVRITTKCRVGDTPAADVPALLEKSLRGSFERMKLDHVDVMFLHNLVVADAEVGDGRSERSVVENAIVPAFESLVQRGLIGAWGLTGIGIPSVLIAVLDSGVRPDYIQIMANLLDSPGGLKRYDGLPVPRDIMAAATRNGVTIMGIRAVQAGALTSGLDRERPADNPDALDFDRAAPFRAIATELGQTPAFLAHQYALSIDGPSTIVLGVKNREELRECIAAEGEGAMDLALSRRIDVAVGRV